MPRLKWMGWFSQWRWGYPPEYGAYTTVSGGRGLRLLGKDREKFDVGPIRIYSRSYWNKYYAKKGK